MSIAQAISISSSLMRVPSSPKSNSSRLVGCCIDQYKPSSLNASSVHDTDVNSTVLILDRTKEQIRKMFEHIDISFSSYDTAWVAMVPSPKSPESPCFPECLNWLMNNQLNDGSWGLLPNDSPNLIKDSLSSTIACVVALKQWNVGEDQIRKGLSFIESNFASATDKDQLSPYGFDIIFSCMLDYAKDLNVTLPLEQEDLSLVRHQRETTLRRLQSNEMEAYLAYISEGISNYYDWNIVKKYQMKNGSIFNSPSATSAALIKHQDDGCRKYLSSLLDKFGNAVPTVYPIDLYVRLSMVDTLEALGIARHFRVEIQDVLDETYRCWMQGDEQIFKDVVTCALAFRILRINGYEISTDPLAEITKDGADYINSLGEHEFRDVYAALDVYRASQFMYQDELLFQEQCMWSTDFLKQKEYTGLGRLSKYLHKEVNNALEFPFNAGIDRISTRRNIENYIIDDTRVLKTTYRSSNISNKEFLKFAVDDYNACQLIFREELKTLEGWVVDYKLDKLKFARQKTAYCYFCSAVTLASPELSDARIAFAKSSILSTVIDDFFDVVGSIDEIENFIQCVQKWNVNVDKDCCSDEVRILFLALKDTIIWIGDAASKWQGRDVKQHIIEVWLELLESWFREAIWTRDGYVPTINEYMENGYTSFALGPVVLPALYLIGPNLSESIIQSYEYRHLFKLASTQGRLLNDIQSFKREFEAGKLNVVALHIINGKRAIQEEDVVKDLKLLINNQRRECIKLVMEAKGSVVPKACKDVFWKTCNVLSFFYAEDDGFSGNAMFDIVNEVIYEPVSHKLMM
ncbi:ent-kaurene synthase 2, chloroplastic-like [Rutidosis leptorrhynchoides]|uniref:ent-kaurene synthase 2, chloroplastic-like n=1 Tax=Rutidosis leptorrhynchoides TaxID=125765 RepID=UPI003A992B35